MFLEETHHKGRFKKQEDSSSSCREMINQNAESDNSDSDTATDVEMISLSDGVSNGLAENTLPLTNQIADSDVDSQSDVTTIPDSDTDLLLGTDVGVAHRARRDWVRRKIDQIRTFDLGSCAKKFLRLQRRQCLECCWCCFDNPDDNATKPQQEKDPSNSPLLIMKRIANKFLLSVWRILCLLKDRRVLLSIFLYSCLGSTTAINNEVSRSYDYTSCVVKCFFLFHSFSPF